MVSHLLPKVMFNLYLGIEFYLFVSHGGMNDRGSTCKFRNARSPFRNLDVDPCLSYLHEKQTSRIQSFYLYFMKIVPFWLRNIRIFNTKHPVIILRGSLFVVTPAHVASWKNGCQNFSYVYRSRKH